MTMLRAHWSAEIAAPAHRVYAILADYRNGHPKILPRNFAPPIIIKGGQGAGTEIRVRTRMLGMSRCFAMKVAEPEPGRILTESDLEAGIVTAFTVDPAGAERSRVQIATVWSARRGFTGKLEAWLMPRMLARVYRKELYLLSQVVLKPPPDDSKVRATAKTKASD